MVVPDVHQQIKSHHHKHADDQAQRQIAFRILYFANDVTGCIPAGVGIHHVNKCDRECATKDRHRVGSMRQKNERLLLLDKQSSPDQRGDQEQFDERPKILECAAETKISEMEKGRDPDEHE